MSASKKRKAPETPADESGEDLGSVTAAILSDFADGEFPKTWKGFREGARASAAVRLL